MREPILPKNQISEQTRQNSGTGSALSSDPSKTHDKEKPKLDWLGEAYAEGLLKAKHPQ